MLRTFFKCATLSAAAMASAGTAGAQPLSTVSLGAKAMSAGGIRTVALQRTRRAPRVAAFGRVLDPGPLISLSARIAAARGTLAAAQAASALKRSEAARASNLYRTQHNISQAAFQAAQSQLLVAQATQASAQARLGELLARARSDWGARLGAAAASGTAPLPELESGAEQIVEVSLPLGQSLPPPSTDPQASTPDGKRVALRLVGRAPRAAAGVAGPGLYYLMATQDSAPIGTPLTVSLRAHGAVAGVLIPASAVVWHDGRALVYRQSAPGAFAPVAMPHVTRTQRGYFVADLSDEAPRPGQRIVVSGAALVFSASQSPPATAKIQAAKPGDDDD